MSKKVKEIDTLNLYKINNPTVGCDIEFVIIDDENQPVNAIGFVPGTKEEPHPIGNGCFIHNDNVMVEFSMPPSNNVEEFVGYLHYCDKFGNSFVTNNSPKDKKYYLNGCTSVDFSDEQLEIEGSKEFGCSVSFNAYNGKMMKPSAKKAGNMRTAGYHLHVGFKQEGAGLSLDQVQMFIRTLDLFVTLPSVVFDMDTRRRTLYGKAGDHRFREIDDILVVELRTLGNNLFQDSSLVVYSYNQLMRGINYFNECVDNGFASLLEDSSEIQRIINEHDVDAAINMCDKYSIELPLIEVGFNAINFRGLENVTSVEENKGDDETTLKLTERVNGKIINLNKNLTDEQRGNQIEDYPESWERFNNQTGLYENDFREEK